MVRKCFAKYFISGFNAFMRNLVISWHCASYKDLVQAVQILITMRLNAKSLLLSVADM